jgi:UPF0755 protein
MLRSLVELVLFLAIVVGLGAKWLYDDYHEAMSDPLAVGDKPVVYVVESGATFRTVAGDINGRGWWPHSSRYFLWTVHQRQLANRLKSGEYEIPPGTTVEQLMELLVSGRTVQYQLTLVEGWNFRQVREAIAKSEILKKTIPTDMDDAGVMELLGYKGQHPEGRFFPDTYNITRSTTDVELLQRAHESMRRILDEAWSSRRPDLPYRNADEALIMASIVEKETGIVEERPMIANVFVQRLQKGMKLQTDPTVIYGIGDAYDGNIRKKDLETDTPYNTYTRTGLPPTPIAMPGREAIRAALNPADGEALYFVARGDGGHYFSRTLDEHNEAVRKYQLGQRNANPEAAAAAAGKNGEKPGEGRPDARAKNNDKAAP